MTGPSVKPGRAAREAAALRQNLLKRKDQARQRQEANQPEANQAEQENGCPGGETSPAGEPRRDAARTG